MPRTLIIKLGAIGDVIMLIPAAHALYRSGHTVDWVISSTVLPILSLYPWITPIVTDESALLKGTLAEKIKALIKLWARLTGRRYDQVATLYYDPRYSLMALPVFGRRKFRLSHTDRLLRLIPGRHHTDEYARILLSLPDQARPNHQLPVPVPPESLPPSPLPRTLGKTRVLLAPAGARNLMRDDLLRRWPAESYAELVRLLLSSTCGNSAFEVVLIGGPDDTWIRSHFEGLPVTDLIASLTLPQTLALLNSADVLVTHDTGPLHLAGLTSIAIVSLFGPTDPHGRLPQRPGALAIWGGQNFACRPCYDGQNFAPCPSNDCMRQIDPIQVLTQVVRACATPLPRPQEIIPAVFPLPLVTLPGNS